MCARHRDTVMGQPRTAVTGTCWKSLCQLGERRTLFYGFCTAGCAPRHASSYVEGLGDEDGAGQYIRYSIRQACARYKAYILAARLVAGTFSDAPMVVSVC